MARRFRITYATLSADNEELQQAYDEAAERMKVELGKEYPVIVNGEERWREDKYDEPSPIDHDVVIGRFSRRHREDVDDAVAAAKAFSLEWDRMGWQERVRILRNAADIMEERLFDLAALMAYEVGKSRLEALGDVQETAELIRWNCDEMEKHDGFRTPMSGLGAAGDYYDVMRPYGVWAVISPFNFPMALSGGPSSGALVAGNSVVLKPSNQGALLGYKLYECYRDGGRSRRARSTCGRTRRGRGRRALEAPRRRRHHVHRLVPGGDGHLPEVRDRRPEAGDLRDGRQEPGDRHEERGPGRGDRRRAAVGVRVRRAEVLGVLARVRRARGLRRLRRPAEGEDREAQGREPARARRLPGADHQRGRARHVRGGGGRGRGRTARS